MIRYVSTRDGKQEIAAAQAVIRGIAPDKGLYVPTEIPELPFAPGAEKDSGYKEIANKIIGAFFTDYTQEEIDRCVEGAYDEKFDTESIVPIRKAGDAYFLELYHGKTAAFKDMALSILPYLLTTAVKKENEDKKICILTATSGDTGKAALEGFADVPGTEIIVFYPDQGVSKIQETQMITQEGENTHVFGIKGNFDDAQTAVKDIFSDPGFRELLEERGCRFSSANSINIGRLVPQVAYYVYGYEQLVKENVIQPGDPINVVVPTGNFGNILAAYYAMRMGMPVNRLVCASNKNRILTDFLATGKYDTNRDFYLTNSPSMDILVSSNLERLLFHLSDEDPEAIRDMMQGLETKGRYTVSDKIRQGLELFAGGSCDVEETNAAIGKMWREQRYLMDTHTAVAYKVYQDYRAQSGDETPALIASTASAYKFAESVAEAVGLPREEDGFKYIKAVEEETKVPVPAGLKDLDKKEVRHNRTIEISEMRDVVLESLSGAGKDR